MNNKKKIILGSIIGILVGGLLGISYAMFTYNSSSLNNKLIAGDIYMRYKEESSINLNGAMPSATYPTEASGNYFEFQIIGKNTNTTKDITYNVKLAYGDNHQTRTTRIDDEYLVFKLVEVVNNEEQTPALVEDQSFDTIPGATLYTTTIPKNTTTESTRTFRVYARISEEVGIGTNTTYTESQWNNLYASVKINVDGGFVVTPTPIPSSNEVYVVSSTQMYIGNPIPEVVNQRIGVNGPAQAMADWQDIIGTPGATLPFYLKYVILSGEYDKYCFVEIESGKQYDCYNTLAECEDKIIHRDGPEHDRCDYKKVENPIEESYVEFVITNELKTQLKTQYCNNDATCEAKYDNLVNGTYTLKGDDGGASYQDNVDEIKTAFNYDIQPSICNDYQAFNCGLSGLFAFAYSGGGVGVNDRSGFHDCHVNQTGDFNCR